MTTHKILGSSLLASLLLTASLNAFAQNGARSNRRVVLKQAPPVEQSTDEKIREFLPKDGAKPLTLKDAIEEGLRKNPDERVRDFDRELLDLGWEGTYDEFWFPNISLTLNTDAQPFHKIDKWKSGNSGDQSPNNDTAAGYFGIELGQYTLFNWGIDYLEYLNSRSTYLRNRRVLRELRRNLKHNVIDKYFELAYFKRKEEIYQKQLRNASFIYRLGREKASLRKITKQEYYQARLEYLRSQREFQQSKREVAIKDQDFAFFLGDDLDSIYNVRDQLNYKALDFKLIDALKFSQVNSPDILNAKLTMENGQRSYERQLKDNLPLPKFFVDLGTYTHAFNKEGYSRGYNTYSGSKNIELVASINATWTLFGSNGFFNRRTTQTSLITKLRSERVYERERKSVETSIRNLFQEILRLEKEIEILQGQTETASKSFDTHLQNYMNKKTGFVNLKDSLRFYTDYENQLEYTKYLHLMKKVSLAKLVGIEDFPGESFESLGITRVQ